MATKLIGPKVQSSHPLARGLVSAWIFNEGAGSKLYDFGAHRFDLDITAAVWGNHGPFGGNALEFDGASSLAKTSGAAPDELQPITLSVVAWVRTDDNTNIQEFVRGASQTAGKGAGYVMNFNRIIANEICAATIRSDNSGDFVVGTISDKDWHQVVHTYDGLNQALYVDGLLVDSNTTTDPFYNATGAFLVGSTHDTPRPEQFDGQLDQLRIYDRPLSAQEAAIDFTDPWALYDQKALAAIIGTAPAPFWSHHYRTRRAG